MDITQLVVIGDTHLQPGPRQADRRQALETIIAAGLALPRLGAWIWPGDLFHATSTIDDRNALADYLTQMAGAAPVVIVQGNHDRKGDLDIFGRLAATHPIIVATEIGVVTVPLPTGVSLAVFALPYQHKGALIGAGVAAADVNTVAREKLWPRFADAGNELAAARANGALPLFAAHGNIAGAVASTGQPQIGKEIELDAALLELLGDIPKVVNHIHRGQEIAGAWIPGSTCRMDFGEVEPKRWLLLEYSGPETYRVVEHPLEVPGLWHCEGRLSREGITLRVTKGPQGEELAPPASWGGQDVRAVFRVDASERAAVIDRYRAEILAYFAGARHLKYELVTIPDRALRAPAVATARTTADRAEAWAGATGTALPADLIERLPLLEHEDEASVVAQVRDWCEGVLCVEAREAVSA